MCSINQINVHLMEFIMQDCTFHLLHTINDPDIQRSLNFLLIFSQKFGRRLDNA